MLFTLSASERGFNVKYKNNSYKSINNWHELQYKVNKGHKKALFGEKKLSNISTHENVSNFIQY